MKYSKLAIWSSIFGFTILTSAPAGYFNFYNYLIENDPTKISLLIISIFTISSIITGWQCYTKKTNEKIIQNLWFSSQAMVTLGMIGTVIGFLLMLSNSFAELDITSTESAQNALKEIGIGMATALLTTFCGMTGGLLLQIQLLVVDDEK